MAGGALSGGDCKLYYNSASYASPTLVEVTKAVDVDFTIDKGYGDASSRSSGWKKNVATLKDLTINFGYRYRQGATDTVFDALRAAGLADTPIELFVLDGVSSAAGNEGIRAYVDLAFGRTEALEDGVLCPFVGKHVAYEDSGTERNPEWYTTTE